MKSPTKRLGAPELKVTSSVHLAMAFLAQVSEMVW